MITIALTGGIGTGKSTAVAAFREILEERLAIFDSDSFVHELLTNPSVIGKLTEAFGESILSSDGQIDRGTLREIVFDDPGRRRNLEAILHPRVLDAGRQARTEAVQTSRPDFFIHEVPLLYEVDFPIERDTDVVVAATRMTQERRLEEKRGLTEEMIEKMLAAQMPMEEKIDRADIVIWNDGPEQELREQVFLAINAMEDHQE